MGVIDKLKGRMQGPMKAGFPVTQNNTSETNEQDTQVSAPFNSNDSAKMALSLSKDNIKTAKGIGKFAAKQGVKQGLKAVGQKALATVFGLGGMLLSSQKAYAGQNRTQEEWDEFHGRKKVYFKNPNTGDVKSVMADDADAWSQLEEFKDYVPFE